LILSKIEHSSELVICISCFVMCVFISFAYLPVESLNFFLSI
jgi:hypothetical protein